MTTFEVYRITDLINNKIYIGATTEGAGVRFIHHIQRANSGSQYPIHRAIREHGKENFKVEILEMCDDLPSMNEKEAYWIAKLSSTNKEIGYNVKVGGGIRFQSEESKAKISLIHKGKTAHNRTPILQYNTEGRLIKEYNSISEATIETGITKTSILRVLNKQATRFSKKNPYVWAYKPENVEDIKLEINPRDYYLNLDFKVQESENFKNKRESNRFKDGKVEDLAIPVEQYTLSGKLIATYRSMKEAEKATGISVATIRKYVNDINYINCIPEGRRKFNWKKADINNPELKITRDDILSKAKKVNTDIIVLIDDDGVITEIDGIVKAAKQLKTDSRILKRHIYNSTPYKGYLIKYKKDMQIN